MKRASILLLGLSACTAKEQPNLVYVFADQLRYDAIGANGNDKAFTPRIDEFASQAFQLTNTTTVAPVSAAYRSSLFTGKYISSTGLVINEICMNPNHRYFAQVCNDNGYNCGYIGKVHLNDAFKRPYEPGPERMGFDDYWAAYTFNHKSYRGYYFTDTADSVNVRVDLKGQYSPDVYTGLACDYLKKAAAEKKPFAMFLSWNPSHDPWTEQNTDPECYERFRDVTFKLPPNFKADPDPYMDRYPSEFMSRECWNDEFVTGDGYNSTLRAYYAMVSSIDRQFGRILDVIDSLGIADNTIVVFTSDHGEQFTSQGRMYKMTFYNESAHVPMFIRYPKKMKHGQSDACFNTPDIMPTLLSLMGMKKSIPAEVEGRDLSFILTGDSGVEPEDAFLQGMGHTYKWIDGFEWRCVRSKEYCYARYLRDGKELLFDQKNDIWQMHDLAADPAYAEVLEEYRARMEKHLWELNDKFKPCTWYREHWMYKDYSIAAAAQGAFEPLPPLEPWRKD